MKLCLKFNSIYEDIISLCSQYKVITELVYIFWYCLQDLIFIYSTPGHISIQLRITWGASKSIDAWVSAPRLWNF